jgi:hypothetical protein
MDSYKPKDAASALKDRARRIDEAVEGRKESKALPEPKEVKQAGLPDPGLFKKIKGLITGRSPYVE